MIGGCFDPEFQDWSNGLIEDFRIGTFHLVLSDVTAAEIERAPEAVRELYRELLSIGEILAVTEEVLTVLSAYESHGVLGSRFRSDMLLLHWLPWPRSMYWSAGISDILSGWIKYSNSTESILSLATEPWRFIRPER